VVVGVWRVGWVGGFGGGWIEMVTSLPNQHQPSTHIYIHTHTYIDIYTHIHSHTHTHPHTQEQTYLEPGAAPPAANASSLAISPSARR
jgi:hypothetical protein